MRRYFIAFVVLLGAGTLSFAAKKTPEWIAGTSRQYPPESFIIGVGVGDSLDGARSAARAEIAKVFKSRIIQSASDSNSEKTNRGDLRPGTESRTASEMKTNISTDEILEGVEIAQTWEDIKKRRQYALAVLNKQKLRQLLARQIEDREESLARRLADAGKAAAAVDGIKALTAALRDIDIRDELAARRRVVDPAPIPGLPGTSRSAIEKQREELLQRIEFVVTAENDDHLVSLISSRITARGFRVLPAVLRKTPGVTVVAVKAKRSTVPFERNNPHWKFYNWQAGLDMTDSEGKIIAAVIKTGQSAHVTADAAESKAFTEAGDTLAAAADTAIKQYFFGE
jgi:hypothetical protein